MDRIDNINKEIFDIKKDLHIINNDVNFLMTEDYTCAGIYVKCKSSDSPMLFPTLAIRKYIPIQNSSNSKKYNIVCKNIIKKIDFCYKVAFSSSTITDNKGNVYREFITSPESYEIDGIIKYIDGKICNTDIPHSLSTVKDRLSFTYYYAHFCDENGNVNNNVRKNYHFLVRKDGSDHNPDNISIILLSEDNETMLENNFNLDDYDYEYVDNITFYTQSTSTLA